MVRSRALLGASAAAVVLLLSSCSSKPADSEADAVEQPTAQSAPDKLVTTEIEQSAQDPQDSEVADQEEEIVGELELEELHEVDEAAGFENWDVPNLENEAIITEDGPALIFHDMRVGEHDGFYRVVVEFAGEGEPGWVAREVDLPLEQGRGEALDVQGNHFLDLSLTGTTIPMLEEDYQVYYSGPKKLAVGPLEVIEDGTYEGSTHIVVGLDQMRDIRFERLEDPARFVVDIRR